MKINYIVVGEIRTNCYIVSSARELAIIDPGGDAEEILNVLKETKVELKYIINTHYHFDHTLANNTLKQVTKARILIHEAEKDSIDFKADKFLLNNDKIEVGDDALKVIHTPGHSRGSICLSGQDFIFTGDTLFRDGYGRTDLPGGSDKEMQKSLIRLSKTLKSGTKIYPGHGEPFIYKLDSIKSLLSMFL